MKQPLMSTGGQLLPRESAHQAGTSGPVSGSRCVASGAWGDRGPGDKVICAFLGAVMGVMRETWPNYDYLVNRTAVAETKTDRCSRTGSPESGTGPRTERVGPGARCQDLTRRSAVYTIPTGLSRPIRKLSRVITHGRGSTCKGLQWLHEGRLLPGSQPRNEASFIWGESLLTQDLEGTRRSTRLGIIPNPTPQLRRPGWKCRRHKRIRHTRSSVTSLTPTSCL